MSKIWLCTNWEAACEGSETPPEEWSEERILTEYYPSWCKGMKQAGYEELITEENCIDDWVVVNWAWEKK